MNRIVRAILPPIIRRQIRGVLQVVHYRARILAGLIPPLTPPSWLHNVGGGDFHAIGEQQFECLKSISGVKPNDAVIDIGCGTARLARPLTSFLVQGSYDGIDIVKESIEWCQQTYTPRFPNFHFYFSDLYNKVYNPGGKLKASEYRFPFDDSSFDFAILTSVFTHMLPADMANYVGEIRRVLKPGGRCYATFFLLVPESEKLIKEQRSSRNFQYQFGECLIENKDFPEGAIGYRESHIRKLYDKESLQIVEPIHYGSWCGRSDGRDYQDIIIAVRES